MSTTITHASSTITPDLIDGFNAARQSANIVHQILGLAEPDVTIRPALLRAGTLRLIFSDETASKDAEDLHATGGIFTLASTERASIDMDYVVSGTVRRYLSPETRNYWVLEVDFQEVAS